jgi:hypothetical protein
LSSPKSIVTTYSEPTAVLPFRIELAGLTEESNIRSVATTTLNFILRGYFVHRKYLVVWHKGNQSDN